jgi:hypothetical protein
MGMRVLRISNELLVQMFAPGLHPGGYEVIRDGLPADTRILHIFHDAGEVGLKIASAEFDGPGACEAAPEITPILRTLPPREEESPRIVRRAPAAPSEVRGK